MYSLYIVFMGLLPITLVYGISISRDYTNANNFITISSASNQQLYEFNDNAAADHYYTTNKAGKKCIGENDEAFTMANPTNMESYRAIVENDFIFTAKESLKSFSVDMLDFGDELLETISYASVILKAYNNQNKEVASTSYSARGHEAHKKLKDACDTISTLKVEGKGMKTIKMTFKTFFSDSAVTTFIGDRRTAWKNIQYEKDDGINLPSPSTSEIKHITKDFNNPENFIKITSNSGKKLITFDDKTVTNNLYTTEIPNNRCIGEGIEAFTMIDPTISGSYRPAVENDFIFTANDSLKSFSVDMLDFGDNSIEIISSSIILTAYDKNGKELTSFTHKIVGHGYFFDQDACNTKPSVLKVEAKGMKSIKMTFKTVLKNGLTVPYIGDRLSGWTNIEYIRDDHIGGCRRKLRRLSLH